MSSARKRTPASLSAGTISSRCARLREGLVEPLREAFLRAAVGAELDRLELHRPEPAVLGLQEERHFGFAEAVDRLHRVADEEQRAAVARLPSRSQLGQQFELRER